MPLDLPALLAETGALLSGTADRKSLAATRFAADGIPVGDTIYFTHDGSGGADLEYASSGNLLAAWTQFDDDSGDVSDC